MVLLLAEALRLLDGEGELLDELVVGLVRGQVQPVEARVRARQPRLLPDLQKFKSNCQRRPLDDHPRIKEIGVLPNSET